VCSSDLSQILAGLHPSSFGSHQYDFVPKEVPQDVLDYTRQRIQQQRESEANKARMRNE